MNKASAEIAILAMEWAIEKLSDYPDTKTAREILQRELMNFRLKLETL